MCYRLYHIYSIQCSGGECSVDKNCGTDDGFVGEKFIEVFFGELASRQSIEIEVESYSIEVYGVEEVRRDDVRSDQLTGFGIDHIDPMVM